MLTAVTLPGDLRSAPVAPTDADATVGRDADGRRVRLALAVVGALPSSLPRPFPCPGVEIGGPIGGLGGVETGGAATGGPVTGGVGCSPAGVEIGGPAGVTSGLLGFASREVAFPCGSCGV